LVDSCRLRAQPQTTAIPSLTPESCQSASGPEPAISRAFNEWQRTNRLPGWRPKFSRTEPHAPQVINLL
jgi:hypothetical protein